MIERKNSKNQVLCEPVGLTLEATFHDKKLTLYKTKIVTQSEALNFRNFEGLTERLKFVVDEAKC